MIRDPPFRYSPRKCYTASMLLSDADALWQAFHRLRHRELELEDALERAWDARDASPAAAAERARVLDALMDLQRGITSLQQNTAQALGASIKTRMSAAERERASVIQLRRAAKQFPAHQLTHALDRLAARAAQLERSVQATQDVVSIHTLHEIRHTIQELRRAPLRKSRAKKAAAAPSQPATVWHAAALALRSLKHRLNGPVPADLRDAALAELQQHEEALTGHLKILRLSSAPAAERQREQTAIAAALHSIEDMRDALHANRPLPALRNLPAVHTSLTQTKTTRSRKTRAIVTQSPASTFSLRRMFGGLMGFLDAEA